jgi:DNA-binding CsgD family transcriptional regulator
MRATALLDVLEAAYRVEATAEAWLRGVIAAVKPHLDAGLGVAGYFVDASAPDGFVTEGYLGDGAMGSDLGVARFAAWDREVPAAVKRHIHLFGSGGTPASIPPLPGAPALVPDTQRAHGYPTMIGVNAIDASGHGVALAAALPGSRRGAFPFGSRALLDRIAAHLAGGARLRRSDRRPEAVVTAGGKLEHAEGPATSPAARELLRATASRIDRLRARPQRMSAEEATHVWQALYDGRWTLVDSFERDGRRYYLACPNEPRPPAQATLGEREAQVVGALAAGHSNKAIAYELGVSASSVATHLRRAQRKLGASSRVELIRAYQELLRREASPASSEREPIPSLR